MDPLTLIVTALATGAAVALKSVAEQAVKDAYAGLKQLILDQYGDKGDVTTAVASVEAKPESEARQALLKEELATAGADQDEKLLQLAQALLAQADPEGSKAGHYTIIGDGNVIGDDNVVTVIKQQAGKGATQIGQARDVKVRRDK